MAEEGLCIGHCYRPVSLFDPDPIIDDIFSAHALHLESRTHESTHVRACCDTSDVLKETTEHGVSRAGKTVVRDLNWDGLAVEEATFAVKDPLVCF